MFYEMAKGAWLILQKTSLYDAAQSELQYFLEHDYYVVQETAAKSSAEQKKMPFINIQFAETKVFLVEEKKSLLWICYKYILQAQNTIESNYWFK